LYDAGLGAQRIAAHLGCVPATAVRVAGRFLEVGEDGLLDSRRGNGELKVDDDLRQALAESDWRSMTGQTWLMHKGLRRRSVCVDPSPCDSAPALPPARRTA